MLVETVQIIISGVAVGCVYALVALGFVLIYKATEVINFAQGELMMLGAFFALSLVTAAGLPFWFAGLLAMGIMALVGMFLNRYVLRAIMGEPQFAIIMATIALAYILRSVAVMIPTWGTDTYDLPVPYRDEVVRWGQLVISYDHLFIIGTTVLLVVGLTLFFRYTRAGLAMQAISQNHLAASFVGIKARNVYAMVWALAAGIAGIAGVLLAPLTFVHVNMGFIGLKAFPAAILGGFGSIPGAVTGGIIIGIVESFAGIHLPEGFKDIAAYIVLLIVLFIRPQGIFGISLKKRV
jgi:branched-chain amino acid transport system permease protein